MVRNEAFSLCFSAFQTWNVPDLGAGAGTLWNDSAQPREKHSVPAERDLERRPSFYAFVPPLFLRVERRNGGNENHVRGGVGRSFAHPITDRRASQISREARLMFWSLNSGSIRSSRSCRLAFSGVNSASEGPGRDFGRSIPDRAPKLSFAKAVQKRFCADEPR